MKVIDLKDLVGLKLTIEVINPVPTLRGPKELEDDDDIDVALVVGSVRIEAAISVPTYRRLAREAHAIRYVVKPQRELDLGVSVAELEGAVEEDD